MARFDLTDCEWSVISPLLPNKPRGAGLPLALKLTEGQAHDGRSARDMLGALVAGQTLLADRAYDSDELRKSLDERGAWANIKPMPNRKNVPAFSTYLYRYRNLVERFFNKIKHYRAVATRYDKTPDNFLAGGAGETTIHLDRWNDREQPHGHIAKRTASPKRRDNAVATITESEPRSDAGSPSRVHLGVAAFCLLLSVRRQPPNSKGMIIYLRRCRTWRVEFLRS